MYCDCICYTEVDYTAGDIDATLSIHSWSYEPRDTLKADSVISLPIIPKGASWPLLAPLLTLTRRLCHMTHVLLQVCSQCFFTCLTSIEFDTVNQLLFAMSLFCYAFIFKFNSQVKKFSQGIIILRFGHVFDTLYLQGFKFLMHIFHK